jgi:DNA-binding response OmpR family regulator
LLFLTLTPAGYRVLPAADGFSALAQFQDHPIDAVLLDVNLPGMDGYAVCAELRKHTMAPILFLFTTCSLEERVRSLELGADGYLIKPFSLQELRARVRALVTRARKPTPTPIPPSLTIGALRLDEWTQQVTVCEQTRQLSPQEFRLLHHLMHHPDRCIPKEELKAIVWPAEQRSAPEYDANRLRVMVNRLRRKIEEDPAQPRYLKTVPGDGYQFCTDSLM